jgi:type IV pilus assembly protein PilN
MRITLNLATRPFADLGPAIKRLRIAMAVLAVVAIGLGWACAPSPEGRRGARPRTLAGRPDRRHQPGTAGLPGDDAQPANAQLLTRSGMLNQLFDEKAFSWTLAMEDLETVCPAACRSPRSSRSATAKDGHITLKLRVVGPRDRAVDLVSNLEHSALSCCPASWAKAPSPPAGPNQRLEPVSASNRVNFELLAEYNPAAASTRRTQNGAEESLKSSAAPSARSAQRRARPADSTPSHGPV